MASSGEGRKAINSRDSFQIQFSKDFLNRKEFLGVELPAGNQLLGFPARKQPNKNTVGSRNGRNCTAPAGLCVQEQFEVPWDSLWNSRDIPNAPVALVANVARPL